MPSPEWTDGCMPYVDTGQSVDDGLWSTVDSPVWTVGLVAGPAELSPVDGRDCPVVSVLDRAMAMCRSAEPDIRADTRTKKGEGGARTGHSGTFPELVQLRVPGDQLRYAADLGRCLSPHETDVTREAGVTIVDKPLRECQQPGCPELRRGARYCEEHRPKSKTVEKGYDQKWIELSLWFLLRHPRCKLCGRIAKIVDHIIPIRAGGARLDPRNLRSLCLTCHGRVTFHANIDSAHLSHRFNRKPVWGVGVNSPRPAGLADQGPELGCPADSPPGSATGSNRSRRTPGYRRTPAASRAAPSPARGRRAGRAE